jgi:hypothetical protein
VYLPAIPATNINHEFQPNNLDDNGFSNPLIKCEKDDPEKISSIIGYKKW